MKILAVFYGLAAVELFYNFFLLILFIQMRTALIQQYLNFDPKL